jgi:hypothetical protein
VQRRSDQMGKGRQARRAAVVIAVAVGLAVPWGGTAAASEGVAPAGVTPTQGAVVRPVTGDWDGNGTDTVGTFIPSTRAWLLRNSNSSGGADVQFGFGGVGDVPVVGDWDGNGTDTIGVYRPSTGAWLLRNSNSGGAPDISFGYGGNSVDRPVTGDWDGDGDDTIGLHRIRLWLLRNSNSSGGADLQFEAL